MQASCVSGASGMPSELNDLPYGECDVGGGDDVGSGLVDRGVDHERGPVDRVRAVHDVAVVVDQDEVADADVAKADAERVDPEVVGELRIAHRDVAGDALAESEPTEDPQRAGELAAAVVALLLDGRERRWEWHRRPASGVSSMPSIVGGFIGAPVAAIVGAVVSVMAMSFTLLPVRARA